MKNDFQNKSEPKKCIVPGCEKTLPSDAVLPVCAYHLDEAKDKGLKIGGGVLTIASGVVMFVKKRWHEVRWESGGNSEAIPSLSSSWRVP